MSMFSLSGLLIGITSLSMSVFIFLKSKGNSVNKLWSIFCLCVAVWGFGCLAIGYSNAEKALMFWRIAYVGVIFIPALFYHFVINFLGVDNKKSLFIAYALTSGFLILNFTNLMMPSTTLMFGELYYLSPPGFLYPFFVFYFVLLVVSSHVKLWNFMKKTQNQQKAIQVRWFFMATLVGFAGGITCFLPVFNYKTYPYGNFTVPLYPLIMSYAIVKHQLMDIEVIVRRTAVFAGLFAFVYGVFTVVTILGQEFFKNSLGWNQWVAMIPTVAIITFSLRPLENFLTNVTEKFLFQKKYDYRELLKLFTNEVLMIVDLQKLTEQTIAGLNNIIKIESAAVFLHDKDAKTYKLVAGIGTKEKDIKFDEKSLLVSFLKSTQHPIVKDKSVDSMESGELKESFRRMNAQVSLPIASHDDLIGILSLGMKKSGEDYTQDDLDILGSLARTLGIAIRNAQLFDEQGKTQAVAAQAEKMAVIGTLASGINHEICNPLGIVRGQSEMFLLNYKDGFYKEKTAPELLKICADIMQKIIKETDRATAITKKLSSFAKPSKKGDFEDVYIDKEIDEVIGLVGHDLKINNIEFKKEFSPNFPAIHADKKQMQEVLFNIIRNAAQAIEGLKQSGKISVTGVAEGSMAGIYISDTGGGIPPDKIGQIFNPFYTTKAPGKGTGLGLFIVKQVVERNKGSILVESEYGVGTTFILKFPISDLAVAA